MNTIAKISIGAAIVAVAVGGSLTAFAVVGSQTPTATVSTTATATAVASADPSTALTSAPTVTPTPWPYTQAVDGPARYLTAVKSPGTLLGISIPSDADLQADGLSACNQLAAGIPFANVNVIADDLHPVMVLGLRANQSNSETIADLASELLCTEYNIENRPITAPTP